MSKKEMTLIYYYVPQDKDDPDCPNVFGVPYNKTVLKLSHIYQSFPLKGTYIFRFKFQAEGQIVWLDLPDVDAKLPTFKDKVHVKATRVSWQDSKLHSNYRQKANIKHEDLIAQKAQTINFFDNSINDKKIEEQKSVNTNNNKNPIDLLNQNKMPSQVQPDNSNNLFSDMTVSNNYLNLSNTTNMNLLGEFSPLKIEQKKNEINLMGNFENSGDLI